MQSPDINSTFNVSRPILELADSETPESATRF